MSLLLFSEPSSLFAPPLWPRMRCRRQLVVDPFESIERFLHRQLQQAEGQAEEPEPNEQSGDLALRMDVAGFDPKELSVELAGDEVVVRGQHQEQREGESLSRQFERRVRIPDGIQRDSIKCRLEPNGRLCVTAKREPLPEAEKRTIPIEMGEPQEEQQEKKKD